MVTHETQWFFFCSADGLFEISFARKQSEAGMMISCVRFAACASVFRVTITRTREYMNSF